MARYRVTARIRRYDAAAGDWVTALAIMDEEIVSLVVRFLGYRVEDRASIAIQERGSVDTEKIDRLVDTFENHPFDRYRLDIFAPDERKPTDRVAWPSGWLDSMIFWSGPIVRRRVDRHQMNRRISIDAVGWTDHLARIPISNLDYRDKTLAYMVENFVDNYLAPLWPGTIEFVGRSEGLDQILSVPNVFWTRATAAEILEELADFGNFFWGVSCSGYPLEESSTAEFRVVFVEPQFQTDQNDTDGLGTGSHVYIDERGPDIVDYFVEVRDEDFANRWDVTGEEVYLDFLSIESGAKSGNNYVLDKFAFATGNTSGMDLWREDGATGLALVPQDRAIRGLLGVDDYYSNAKAWREFVDSDGNSYLAGVIFPLPDSVAIQGLSLQWDILSWAEPDLGTDDLSLFRMNVVDYRPWPESADALPDIKRQAIRYRLVPNGARMTMVLKDWESANAREEVSEAIRDTKVRGTAQGGSLALQSRWIQFFESENATLSVRRWRRVPNGRLVQTDNVVTIGTGKERLTRLGTTGNGGDGWKVGDDERPVGLGRTYEIRQAEMRLAKDGWDVQFSLAAAARELAAAVFRSSEIAEAS